ncbi:MAG: galactokinase family protein [Gemmatimonadales bacterium]
MTTAWHDAVRRAGLSDPAAELAAEHFGRTAARHARHFAGPGRAWWVPGRIEVLGKHTDYGGGRSLLAAVERGFHVIASPRPDNVVHIVDASTGASLVTRIDAAVPNRPRHWTDYPISVVRRIARDFPGASTGMNMAMNSSLPSASGLSSSSALVIACFLPLAAFNALDRRPEWTAIADPDARAEYLGAIENGRAYDGFAADHGVGTQGGSEDQTAITRALAGHLLQYRFIPVLRERVIPIPPGWRFVVAMSGAHAPKGAAVQARYNALSEEITTLLGMWNQATGRHDRSLLASLESAPAATEDLTRIVANQGGPDADKLAARLAQFREESELIIPEVCGRIENGSPPAIGDLVTRSQSLAETVLGNQIPETIHLARRARDLGAAAATAFGAGFGGSVWALVSDTTVDAFLPAWRRDYLEAFPRRAARAVFFVSAAGPAATELGLPTGPSNLP